MHQTPFYLGISVPDTLSKQIAEVQHGLIHGPHMRQPLEPHITLIHPHAAESLAEQDFAARARQIATAHLPLTITLDGFGRFGGAGIYMSVKQTPELMQLHRELVKVLPHEAQAEHYPQHRPYTPHITLAQAPYRSALPPELLNEFTARLQHLLPVSFMVNQLTLYHWLRPRTYEEILL